MSNYESIDGKWNVDDQEKEGVHKGKVWLEHVETKILALFKPDTENNESITEHEVYKIASKLDIPCAKIELVEFEGRKGCLSHHYNLHYEEQGKDLVFIHADDLYEKDDMVTHKSKDSSKNSLEMIPEMTLEIVKERISVILPDVVNMLFLDCLVSNRDRHGYNWDLVMDDEKGEVVGLAPLFDHGYSLEHKFDEDHDNCALPWTDDVELTHYAMFEMLSTDYPEQVKSLLEKSAKIDFIEFVQPRFNKMCEIFERVIKIDEQDKSDEHTEPSKPEKSSTERSEKDESVPEKPIPLSPKPLTNQSVADEQQKAKSERQKSKPTLKERTEMANKS